LRRNIHIGVRVIIAIAAYLFIAIKIGSSGILKLSDVFIDSLSLNNLIWIILVLILMPIVWALEAYKWRIAIQPFTNISFLRSWRSVWYGVVAGQLTPNRIGEPIGRLALIAPDVRGKAGIAAVWCSLSQQSVTVFFGFLSIAWWLLVVNLKVLPEGVHFWIISFLILFWTMFLLIAIAKVSLISSRIEKIGWIKNALHGESIHIGYKPYVVFVVFSISSLRYLLFSTQYVILLKVFGVQANSLNLYAAVGLTYLFNSFIPSYSVSEVGTRAGLAIWFVGMLYNNPIGVTTASVLIWLLNIAVPALIGAWFSWKMKDDKLLGE
jgi:hypothetical protein